MKFLILFFVLISLRASAYIGPGIGIGAVGFIFGLLGTFFVAFCAVLYYPLKRFVKNILGTGKKQIE